MSSFSASAVIFNVGKGDEGVVQNGTRHVQVDERGWLWLTRRAGVAFLFCFLAR